MLRAKSIDEIYREVSDCGLVVTNDAALATALNALVDKAMIGSFAVTPKMIAARYAVETIGDAIWSDMRVVSTVCEETGYDFRYVHSEISNIREIRRYTQDVSKHLYTRASRNVYESYRVLPTQERVMESFDPSKCELYRERPGDIAVVGVDFFNNLDKHFIPYDFNYRDVEIFTESEEFSIDTINAVGNDRQVAENAVALITPETANDVAIIMNAESPMADAVRTALYRNGIPFINSLNVRDLAQIRDYLQFVNLSLSFETLRVKNVREIFSNYNGFFSRGNRDEYLLSRYPRDEMTETTRGLVETMENIRSLTFDDVRLRICNKYAKTQIKLVLDDLMIASERITSELVSRMRYAVDNLNDLRHNEQVPPDEKAGVLLADCGNSVFVDRPLVMYLGMEQDWNANLAGKRYLDVEDETEKNTKRMMALLQQGERRIYIVNTTKGGNRARPSTVFDMIMGKPVSGFEDICREVVKGRWYNEPEPPEMTPPEQEVSETAGMWRRFSKTTFDRYRTCPRGFFLGALLPSADRTHTEFGNLIHEFAQLYVCHPDVVREKGVDQLADMISDRYSGLSSPLMEGLDMDRIKCAMRNVMRYIDRCSPGDLKLDVDESSKDHPNRFFTQLGLRMGSHVCENEVISTRHPMHGTLDLYLDGIISDYKTGKALDSKEIGKGMDFEERKAYSAFQPLMYLALADEKGGSANEFRLFYVMDNDVESQREDYDIMRNVRVVRLRDGDVMDTAAGSIALKRMVESNASKDWRPVACEAVDLILENAVGPVDQWSDDYGLQTMLLETAGLRDNKTNRKSAGAFVRKVTSCIKADMVVTDGMVEIPRANMDRFLARLDEMHAKAMRESLTFFPPEPLDSCRNCNMRMACTMENAKTASEGGETGE